MWDLWALDWIQQRAECLRFCVGRSVSPAGQLPVSTDIEYEFDTRNPYNFLQVTFFKVSCYLKGNIKSVVFLMLLLLYCSPVFFFPQLEKLKKAAAAAHTYFVANPSHLEMRNNIEKYRRMDGVTEEDFQDREAERKKHWVSRDGHPEPDSTYSPQIIDFKNSLSLLSILH